MTSGEFAVLTWPELANVIREVDGNHDLGAGELAERILRHPKVAAAAQSASGEVAALREALSQWRQLAGLYAMRHVVTSQTNPCRCWDCTRYRALLDKEGSDE